MAPLNVSEVVNYTAQGRTVKALVLSARDGEVSHLGKNGEPLLTLAFKKMPLLNAPHKRPTLLQDSVGTPEIEIVHDVVHASHTFPAKFIEDKAIRVRDGVPDAAQVANHRGHGEWSEVAIIEGSLKPEDTPEPAA